MKSLPRPMCRALVLAVWMCQALLAAAFDAVRVHAEWEEDLRVDRQSNPRSRG